MKKTFIFVSVVALCVSATTALACPEIEGLIDYNCDGRIKIGVVGDSFVAGIGDKPKDEVLGNGYVQRLRKRYLSAVVATYPKPGIISGMLLAKLKQKMPGMASLADDKNLLDSDYIIVDVGRNDFWGDNNPPETVKNLFRIVKFVREVTKKKTGASPQVFVSSLAPTTRSYQRSFITIVNYKLIKYKSSAMPLYIRYDKAVKQSLISGDGIHPKAEGYTKMAETIEKFIEEKGRGVILKSRKDLDADGIYDYYEKSKFGTSSHLYDTDGDGFSDGLEVFTNFTDPLDLFSHP